jgi:hypothetical protein
MVVGRSSIANEAATYAIRPSAELVYCQRMSAYLGLSLETTLCMLGASAGKPRDGEIKRIGVHFPRQRRPS